MATFVGTAWSKPLRGVPDRHESKGQGEDQGAVQIASAKQARWAI